MMTVKGVPACAACKFQRRKCSPNCPLAPYFPVSKTQDFDCVHRLFGVSNVTKTILKLHTKNERDDAMNAIIFEANMRKLSPVHGCAGIVVNLFRKLELAAEELRRVVAQVEACREQAGRGSGELVVGPEVARASDELTEIDPRHLIWLNSDVIGDGNVFGSNSHSSSNNDVTTAYLKPEFANVEQIMEDEYLTYLTTLDPWAGDQVKYNTISDML